MAKTKKAIGLHPTKSKLFWSTQRECFSRMSTPLIMYTFMSMLLLATQTITTTWLKLLLGILCILASMAFDAHLSYTTGKEHYDVYLTGCLHRESEMRGNPSGGDHHLESEYSPWKGFYIGFLVGIPVIILGSIAGGTNAMGNAGGIAAFLLITLAGWAIIPIVWLKDYGKFAGIAALENLSLFWSLALIIIPIIITGIFYIIGAMVERRRKAEQAARDEAVRKLQEQQKYEREHRVQTEEQRKKTLQSKKKK